MKFPFLNAKARLVRIMGTFDLATGHGDTMDELLDSLESELHDVLGYYRQRRKWVGLTDEEIDELYGSPMELERSGALKWVRVIEAKLKEKNA